MDIQVTDTLHHFVNGAKVDGTSGRYGDIYNPSIGAVVRRTPFATVEEVDMAVNAAADALPDWACKTTGCKGTSHVCFSRNCAQQH